MHHFDTSSFESKRKYVQAQTQVHSNQNVSVFFHTDMQVCEKDAKTVRKSVLRDFKQILQTIIGGMPRK